MHRSSHSLKSTPFGQLHHAVPFQPGDLEKSKQAEKAAPKPAPKSASQRAPTNGQAAPAVKAGVSWGGGGGSGGGSSGAVLTVRGTQGGAASTAAVAGAIIPTGKRSKSQVEAIALRVRTAAATCNCFYECATF